MLCSREARDARLTARLPDCQARARMLSPVLLMLRLSLSLALATSMARADMQAIDLAREVRLKWEAREGQLFFTLVCHTSAFL